MYELMNALNNVFYAMRKISNFKKDNEGSNPTYLEDSLHDLEVVARGLTVSITEVAERKDITEQKSAEE